MSAADATVLAWELRFRAPSSRLPAWSPAMPDHCVYASSESGSWQLHAWDVMTGKRRQVTDDSVGVVDGFPTLDGEGVVWFEDSTGDESGHWVVQPFGGGETRPFLPGVPHGWDEGLAQAPGVSAAAISSRDGFFVYVAFDGEPARELHRSTEAVQLGGAGGGVVLGALSADGSLLCLGHAEHGDLIHPALRVVDPLSGETVGEQLDPGSSLHAKCWSSRPGDHRLAFDHDRSGETRPGIWDLASGERQDLEVGVAGEVSVEDWWPDGSALLLNHLAAGRHSLLRYELAKGEAHPVTDELGVILGARVRPDGHVWFLHEQAHRQRRIVDEAGSEVLQLRGAPAPPSQPYESWEFENMHGQHVHGFYVTPEDSGAPFPVVLLVHGGPTFLDMDRWQPEVQALVDAGFAVGLVNYRGSTGYGRQWTDALIGDVGGPEVEDVNAGLHDLVERGIADPERAVIAGFSWGGYITLLELGKHPELWCCGVAGVPVGDYLSAYEDESPLLQAYDRALLGAPPAELPELMRERNPINFVDQVRAPVLVLIGRNDSRCPYRQAMAYVDRLVERGHPHELYVYETGHSAFDVDERVRQFHRILDFLATNVPGVGLRA